MHIFYVMAQGPTGHWTTQMYLSISPWKVLGKRNWIWFWPCRLPQTWQPYLPLHTESGAESKTSILSFKDSVKFPDRDTFLFFKDTAPLCGKSPFCRLTCRRWSQFTLEQITICNRGLSTCLLNIPQIHSRVYILKFQSSSSVVRKFPHEQ